MTGNRRSNWQVGDAQVGAMARLRPNFGTSCAGLLVAHGSTRMKTHNEKLDHSNVVAVFENQDDAEEAVLGLRVAGFSDARVGYFARDVLGIVTDYAGKGHTLAGAAIGLFVGAFVGFLCGEFAVETNASRIGPPLFPGDAGVVVSVAIVVTVLMTMIGAWIGWGIPRGEAVHRGVEMNEGRYVVSVNAADHNMEAWAILHRHGGHAPMPVDAVRMNPVM